MGKCEGEGRKKIMEDRERSMEKERGREIQRERQSYIKIEIVQMRYTVRAKEID